ncbi:hypothetical protein [Paenibacillus lignilyticus]|uniref:Uncharacterized protein n=1 Tax=Paenibacillus lignilyticus TaxID=1172615 RepID=A0ABS5CIB8_9BACL|nr:hypothetical protein [Paenibacillus lignilyticus]MBP3965573.1 hypothetical protein [Paenibacillus lignilyticus]
MVHGWIGNHLRYKWYGIDGWSEYELVQEQATIGVWRGESDDGGQVSVTVLDEQSLTSEYRCSRVEVLLIPSSDGLLGGFQFVMPVDPALELSWKTHLTPLEGMTIGDTVFRSPAIILENESRMCALIPDITHISAANRVIPHIMDYELSTHSLYYGVSDYRETGHVYYQLEPKPRAVQGPIALRFYLVEWAKSETSVPRDYRPVEQFLWERFASAVMTAVEPDSGLRELERYTKYAYEWAFERWESVTWQQFELDGREVGGVVFIVTTRQQPGYGQEEAWREKKSIWNQAWFCSLRSAYGYWMWGKAWGKQDWMQKAEKSLAFALAAPQTNGLFPACYMAGPDNRWEDGRWIMSHSRVPKGQNDFAHLLDCSWTSIWLLKWYGDIDKDERIMNYVDRYVKTLLELQEEDGSFPAWVHPQTLERSEYLRVSSETAAHIMLLCSLYRLRPEPEYLEAAERAAAFLEKHIIAEGRWEDFETYWSCAGMWEQKQPGVRDARSGLYSQCNFGMYWTAEAMRDLYLLTGRAHYLEQGRIVLAEASLYQQIWQPPFHSVPTVGGFGVMNCDSEWNDARQSLFAGIYMGYFETTGDEAYRYRAYWAMKASFYMMYCPENMDVKAKYEQVHPHMKECDYGFHMENVNHSDGKAVGEFTIFDWGCGAASTALYELSKKQL